jgi:hypothetical protein
MKIFLLGALPYILIASISIINWVFFEKWTAFEGPGLDMVIFFERTLDPNFIRGDFLANANQILNPRMVFGYGVVWISKILGISWYTTFFFLKFFFVIAIPILWVEFITLCSLELRPSSQKGEQKVRWLAFIFVMIAIVDHIPYMNDFGYLSVKALFVIAWWPPLFTSTGPQTLAIFLSLCAGVRAIRPITKGRLINPYLIAAAIIHPAVSVIGYVILFLVLASSDSSEKWKDIKQKIIELAVNWFLPCLIILFFFRPLESLNPDLFSYIYVIQAHPHHYWIKELASFSKYSWRFAFFNVIILCALIYFLANKFKFSPIKRLAILFGFFYLAIVLIQYLIVDIYPIKAIVSFAPIRLSMISYWILSILLISSIASRRHDARE